MKSIILAFIVVVLAGCAAVPISEDSEWRVAGDKTQKILLFRPAGSHSKYSPIYFGTRDKYVLALKERQYTWLHLPSSTQTFAFIVRGGKEESATISISSGEEKCLQLKSAVSGLSKLLINSSLIGNPGDYSLKKEKCPTAEQMNEYTYVEY